MTVRRIVPNLAAVDPVATATFYRHVFGLEIVADHGGFVTVAAEVHQSAQLGLARDGGSGAPMPDLSIEVDELDGPLLTAQILGAPILYGPVREPWGVDRFSLRDPNGRIVDVLVRRSATGDLTG